MLLHDSPQLRPSQSPTVSKGFEPSLYILHTHCPPTPNLPLLLHIAAPWRSDHSLARPSRRPLELTRLKKRSQMPFVSVESGNLVGCWKPFVNRYLGELRCWEGEDFGLRALPKTNHRKSFTSLPPYPGIPFSKRTSTLLGSLLEPHHLPTTICFTSERPQHILLRVLSQMQTALSSPVLILKRRKSGPHPNWFDARASNEFKFSMKLAHSTLQFERMYGLRSSVFGIRSMLYGLQSTVYGLRTLLRQTHHFWSNYSSPRKPHWSANWQSQHCSLGSIGRHTSNSNLVFSTDMQ